MYTPSSGQPKPTKRVTKNNNISAPCAQRTSRGPILRGWLLGWAFLRLVVSGLWTGVIIMTTVTPFLDGYRQDPELLLFGVVITILQLVELGMICTFITAGVKKSARLYRAYYRYCILTLFIYIIAVMLSLALDYNRGHYFTEIYLTYHITDVMSIADDTLVFVVTAILDIGLEVLLILSVKFLIKEYSSN